MDEWDKSGEVLLKNVFQRNASPLPDSERGLLWNFSDLAFGSIITQLTVHALPLQLF